MVSLLSTHTQQARMAKTDGKVLLHKMDPHGLHPNSSLIGLAAWTDCCLSALRHLHENCGLEGRQPITQCPYVIWVEATNIIAGEEHCSHILQPVLGLGSMT